jgi:hypothetical protein
MKSLQKLLTPFAVVFLGLAVPVLMGLCISTLFELPKLLSMTLILGMVVVLYVDLIKSYKNF